MPVGLTAPKELLAVEGLELASVAAGIRYQGRDDLVLFRLASGSNVAAVFTQNKCCAAPVTVAKQHVSGGNIEALLINSGNANAATGEKGLADARQSCQLAADELGLQAEQVLPFSTGVIGEPLNMSAMAAGIERASQSLSPENWMQAAKAIMTTDTVAKGVSKTVEINGEKVTITGISKGSGMICPNMATMLAYVVTDANIAADDLNRLLKNGVANSFNRITVDSDTSTNDALVLAATGKAMAEPLSGAALETFYEALEAVLVELATAIIRDGEGATKFVRVDVSQGATQADCRTIAYDIAHSPLVKTALFASDPNWGRILMALGKSAVDSLEMDKVDIFINGISLIEQGQPAATYTEEQGQQVFSQEEITIVVRLHTGDESFHVWTSDLSYDYVKINADYRS